MLLVPKTKKDSPNSPFDTKQASNIDSSVSNIDANLEGFVGTFNKSDKKKQQIAKEQYLSQLHQLKKGPEGDSKDKDTKKKWQKIVGIMGKGIGGLFKGVASIVKGLAGKATGLLGFLLGIFILLKLGLLKTLIPAALDLLKQLVTGIIEMLPDIIKWAWDILKEWVPKLVNAFADAISDALGLKKESKLRKIMPILVGVGAGLFALHKAVKLFGGSGFGALGGLIKGIKALSSFLLANPYVAAAAAIVAAGVGIYAFIKNSEDISKWAEEQKEDLAKQNAADIALINKYKGTDLSKLNKETYAQLKEATERQAGFWKDMKGATYTGIKGAADAATTFKEHVKENEETALKLRMKQKLTDEENTQLQLAAVESWQVLTGDFWAAFINPSAWAEQFKYLWHILKKYIFIPVGNGIMDAITWMNDKIAGGVQYIKDSISSIIMKAITWIYDTITKAYNWLNDKVTKGLNWINDKIAGGVKFIKDSISDLWKKIKKKIQNIWKTIIEPFSKFGNLIQSIGSTIASIWAKLPNPADIGTGISGLVTNMEDFFKPFSNRMHQIFTTIGDVFGALVARVVYYLKLGHIISGGVGVAGNYEQYRVEEYAGDIAADKGRSKAINEYAGAVISGNQARISAAGQYLSSDEKKMGESFAEWDRQSGFTKTFADFAKSLKEGNQSAVSTTVAKFFDVDPRSRTATVR